MFWSKKIVYFVRHGQSAMNATNQRQGAKGSLSEKGKAQARFVGERLKNQHVDIILASPYERTLETANIINETLHKKIEECPLLQERKNPSEIIGKDADSEEVKVIMDKIDRSYHDENYRYSDEENFSDLKNRARTLLDFLTKRKEKHITCVSHRIFLKMLSAYIETEGTLSSHDFIRLDYFNKIENTAIIVCKYGPIHPFSFKKTWKILVFNDFPRI